MGWLTGFSRVTSGGRFIPVVDGLRCVAIGMVLLYHLEHYFTIKTDLPHADPTAHLVHRCCHVGNAGVQVFFAISAFILSVPFLEHYHAGAPAVPIGRYFLRRLTRLEPPYLICLLALFALQVFVQHKSPTEQLPSLLASMGYCHNQLFGRPSDINVVAWSLEIEVQYYVLMPVLAPLLFRGSAAVRRSLLVGLTLAWIAGKSAAQSIPPRVELSLVGAFDCFLVGMLLADLYVTAWASRPLRSRFDDLATLIAWPMLLWTRNQPGWLYHTLPIWSGLAFWGALRGSLTHNLLSRPLIVIVGGMCYSIYLYHFLFLSFVGRFTLPLTAGWSYLPSLLVQILLIVLPTLLGCAILFRLFERPFMQWKPWQRRG